MASTRLYKEALSQFRGEATKEARDEKGSELLRNFLDERTSPEDTLAAAKSLGDDAGKKYGDKKIGKIKIPKEWIQKIFDNISNFVTVGNYAMKGAPESVGLAWYGVKLALTAVQNNYELYTIFGTGLVDITEVMILILHYDRLYDESATTDWKPNKVVELLFKHIISTYVGILKFAFSVKRYLEADLLGKLGHGFKDFFGWQKDKFQGPLNNISALKAKILEMSQAAFQDRSLHQLESVQTIAVDIKNMVDGIQDFQGTLQDLHREQMAQLQAVASNLDDIKASFRPKTPRELALQEFEKNKQHLKPIPNPDAPLDVARSRILEGTCTWAIHDDSFAAWRQSGMGTLLCITGQQGTSGTLFIPMRKWSLTRRDNRIGKVDYARFPRRLHPRRGSRHAVHHVVIGLGQCSE